MTHVQQSCCWWWNFIFRHMIDPLVTSFVSFESSVALVASECTSLKIQMQKFYIERKRPTTIFSNVYAFYSPLWHSFCVILSSFTFILLGNPVCWLFMGKSTLLCLIIIATFILVFLIYITYLRWVLWYPEASLILSRNFTHGIQYS